MFGLGRMRQRHCQGMTRRELLEVGGISGIGATLGDWFRVRSVRGAEANSGSGERDVSCIFVWLNGGPSHFETFDPKPNTPDDIRGPYAAISTSVAGVQFCELMPEMARRMHLCSVVRSMFSQVGDHSPIPMMTGIAGETTAHGAVVTKYKGFLKAIPPYVHVGSRLPVGGGKLGSAFHPAEVPDPTGKRIELPQFGLTADVSADRFVQRRELLAGVDRLRAQVQENKSLDRLESQYRLAVEMLTSSVVREAFDLEKESAALRTRYGMNHFGQACLMGRRLVEAGTRFVQINWYDAPAWHGWDVHGADIGGMERMEQHLCPRLDQGLSALVDDLVKRGMFERTLVVAVGEFGRTPKINKYGARDHWPQCFSALFAGGGTPQGAIIGGSDRNGATPASRPVNPAEFANTIYRLLGLDASQDQRLRPFVGESLPVSELVG